MREVVCYLFDRKILLFARPPYIVDGKEKFLLRHKLREKRDPLALAARRRVIYIR